MPARKRTGHPSAVILSAAKNLARGWVAWPGPTAKRSVAMLSKERNTRPCLRLGHRTCLLASGVALGSWWSITPMAVLALLLIRRTALEDRFLHEHLAGYPEYARRVRFRLIPRTW